MVFPATGIQAAEKKTKPKLPEIPVRNGASNGHLLAPKNKFTAPYQADKANPPHTLHPHWIKLHRIQSKS
jgi:hypothetical protein